MKVYHATPHTFDFPVYEELVSKRTNHANGNLGLWFAMNDSWIKGFGQNIYEIEFSDKVTSTISLMQLKKWNDNLRENQLDLSEQDYEKIADEYYQNIRHSLLSSHKVLLIEEASGECEMGIILDFSVIENFKLQKKEFKLKK